MNNLIIQQLEINLIIQLDNLIIIIIIQLVF